ncbi:MAG: hypothetical protein DHS20C13_27990 [Thermodesulfobacteriota bacterium]|nr:MAG: hypothetical protein DHS20C13_27990 [Thermodesulfobacteriota bacterium]
MSEDNNAVPRIAFEYLDYWDKKEWREGWKAYVKEAGREVLFEDYVDINKLANALENSREAKDA